MTQSVSKNDVAALIALIDLIRLNWDDQPEMYRLLLAILVDYNPSVQGNKERTTRYLRLLISDPVTANCVLKSLPQGSSHIPYRPSLLNYPLKKQHKNRITFRTKKSPVYFAPTNIQNKISASSSDTDQTDTTLSPAAQPDISKSDTAVTPTDSITLSNMGSTSSDVKSTASSTSLNPVSDLSVSNRCGDDQTTKKYVPQSIVNSTGFPFPFQPMYYPSMLGHIHSYAPIPSHSFPLPWSHMPYMHSFQDPSYDKQGNSSQSLLDLSTKKTSSEVMRYSSNIQPPVRALASNVGVAKPVKRSSSLSSLDNVNEGQTSKMAKTETCGSNRSSALPTTMSNKMTPQMDSSISSRNVGVREGQTPYMTLAGAATHNSLNALKQLTTNIRPSPIIASNQLTIARAHNNTSMMSSSVSRYVPPSSTQTCSVPVGAGKTDVTTVKTSEGVKTESCTAVIQQDTRAVSKAFPYSQHIPLPDGRCPVANISVDYTVLGSGIKHAPNTLHKQEANPHVSNTSQSVNIFDGNSKPIINVPKTAGLCISNAQQYYTDGSQNASKVIETNCITSSSSIVELNRDSKSRQVMIKLDKYSSGNFLAELLKLRAGASISSAPHPGQDKQPVTISIGDRINIPGKTEPREAGYRAPSSAICNRMLLPRSHTTARNLLGNTSSSKPLQPKVPATMMASLPVSSGPLSTSSVYSNIYLGPRAALPVRSYSLSDVRQDMPTHSSLKTSYGLYEQASVSGAVSQAGSVTSSNDVSKHVSGLQKLAGQDLPKTLSVRASASMSEATDRALLFALRERLQNVHRTLKENQLTLPKDNSVSDSRGEQKCVLPKPKTPSLSSLYLNESNIMPVQTSSEPIQDLPGHPPKSRSFSLSHLNDQYFTEQSSGGSSAHASPYLVGMLPDKMSDSDLENEDVFD